MTLVFTAPMSSTHDDLEDQDLAVSGAIDILARRYERPASEIREWLGDDRDVVRRAVERAGRLGRIGDPPPAPRTEIEEIVANLPRL